MFVDINTNTPMNGRVSTSRFPRTLRQVSIFKCPHSDCRCSLTSIMKIRISCSTGWISSDRSVNSSPAPLKTSPPKGRRIRCFVGGKFDGRFCLEALRAEEYVADVLRTGNFISPHFTPPHMTRTRSSNPQHPDRRCGSKTWWSFLHSAFLLPTSCGEEECGVHNSLRTRPTPPGESSRRGEFDPLA